MDSWLRHYSTVPGKFLTECLMIFDRAYCTVLYMRGHVTSAQAVWSVVEDDEDDDDSGCRGVLYTTPANQNAAKTVTTTPAERNAAQTMPTTAANRNAAQTMATTPANKHATQSMNTSSSSSSSASYCTVQNFTLLYHFWLKGQLV